MNILQAHHHFAQISPSLYQIENILPTQRENAISLLKENNWDKKSKEILNSLDAHFLEPLKLAEKPVNHWHADLDALCTAFNDCFILPFFNGVLLKEKAITTQMIPNQCVIDSFQTVTDSTNFQATFKQTTNIDGNPFSALNLAFHSDGAYVFIPDHCQVTQPICIIHFSDLADKNIMVHPRTLIIAGEHAHATIIEIYVDISEHPCFLNSLTHVTVSDHAKLQHITYSQGSEKSFHIHQKQTQLNHHSDYNHTQIMHQGMINHADLTFDLKGLGANCHLQSLQMGAQHETISLNTNVHHHQPDCSSHTVSRALLQDKSIGKFQGNIIVYPNAQRTIANLENKNLLLSEKASMVTEPQLEIYHDDVKCSHGATTGYLEKEALFYMQSRGIPLNDATNLLLQGFIEPITKMLLHRSLKNNTLDHLTALTSRIIS